MLEQELLTLAALSGTAVVQAAGTDVWHGLRQAIARWFGRANEQLVQAELERLDQTARELQTAETAERERLLIRHEAAWQTRFTTLLESLDGDERTQAVEELRTLVAQRPHQGGVSAGQGLAVGGNVEVHGDRGGFAVGYFQGQVNIGHPPTPDPQQG